jgi:hypothetical protein
MMCAADTVGVFQIESRAQQGTLPRLKPCHELLGDSTIIIRSRLPKTPIKRILDEYLLAWIYDLEELVPTVQLPSFAGSVAVA